VTPCVQPLSALLLPPYPCPVIAHNTSPCCQPFYRSPPFSFYPCPPLFTAISPSNATLFLSCHRSPHTFPSSMYLTFTFRGGSTLYTASFKRGAPCNTDFRWGNYQSPALLTLDERTITCFLSNCCAGTSNKSEV
jgi:hypothetical protein